MTLLPELLEDIARKQHSIFIQWTQSLARTENISSAQKKKWKKLWVKYEDLSFVDKEYFRAMSQPILKVIQSHNLITDKISKIDGIHRRRLLFDRRDR